MLVLHLCGACIGIENRDLLGDNNAYIFQITYKDGGLSDVADVSNVETQFHATDIVAFLTAKVKNVVKVKVKDKSP